MNLKNIFINAIFILFSFGNNAVYAENSHSPKNIRVTDDLGNQIVFNKPVKRIISLSPGTTELIFSAGGGSLLKGVVSYSDFPEAAKSIPQVGSYNSLDLEKIVTLNPELIVAWESGNPPLQISKLRKLGFTVFISEPRKFSDIPSTITRLGKLMGTQDAADKSAQNFNQRFKQLKDKYTGKYKTKSVFIQIWNKPVMSINGQHLISKIISNCNGRNIFADYPQLTLTPSVETIITLDPDIIIASRLGDIGDSWLKKWKKWGFLKAVKNKQLIKANPDNLVRHTPRILNGMEEVCSLINS